MILYEAITGKMLFNNAKTQEEITSLILGNGASQFELPPLVNTSPYLRDLVSRMLTVDPNKRITIQEVLNHEYLHPNTILNEHKRFSIDSSIFDSKFPVDLMERSVVTIWNSYNHLVGLDRIDYLATLSEFILDIYEEHKIQMPNELKQIIQTIHLEGRNWDGENKQPCHVSAIQSFFQSGVQKAEESLQTNSTTSFKQALDLLLPVVFLVRDDSQIREVRSLYRKIRTFLVEEDF